MREPPGNSGWGRDVPSPGDDGDSDGADDGVVTARLGTYFGDTRDLATSLVLVFPLFVLYQVGLLTTGGVRNGVDFVTRLLFQLVGSSWTGYLVLNFGLLVLFGFGLLRLRDSGDFDLRVFPAVLVESTVYALLFGRAVLLVMQTFGFNALLATGPALQVGPSFGLVTILVLSAGAGFYEELVFRVLLMGGAFVLGVKAFAVSKPVAAAIAVVFSSLAFSAVHHVGAGGEPFALGVFLFRFVAGVLLAGIFYVRGFAVAVYTHAIYDVVVMTGLQ
ncbi:CPBP family intramembrane glutamic endopeptidase [Haloarchaeobius sp. DFWS5]|uniref:CPBP family intramembrane glutamic endopeptidase n=1 Tax=Haloarchaeobius sp. DFWS5 TaxID=3446114 RepID=UPI003EB7E696